MKKITVIVPCYNEEQAIHYFYEEMERIAVQMPENTFEYVFVDDGSRDGTLRCMRELRKKDQRVKYVSFSRNFGKEAAIYAGLTHATGDYVAIMDADLQDPPSLLPEMYRAVTKEGYDSAATRRVTRKGEPPIRSFFARCFYRMMNRISDVELMDGARDYRLMSRQYVDALLSLRSTTVFLRGCSAGSASAQSGLSLKMWNVSQGRQNGPSGSCLNIRSTELLRFPQRRFIFPLCSARGCAEWRCWRFYLSS